MKKISVLILVILLASSLYAEIWVEAGLAGGRDYASTSLKSALENTSVYAGIQKDKGFINSLGPSVSITYFPSGFIRIGVMVGESTNFTIGLNNEGSVGGSTRFFDFREDLKVGLAYYQMLTGSMGLYLDVGYNYSMYRLGLSATRNVRQEPDFLFFTKNALFCDFGLIQKSNNWFFKFGFLYNKNLFNSENSGWSLDVTAVFGYIL